MRRSLFFGGDFFQMHSFFANECLDFFIKVSLPDKKGCTECTGPEGWNTCDAVTHMSQRHMCATVFHA